MRSFRDTFEKRKRSFISAFSICMTAPLINNLLDEIEFLKNGLRSKDTTINLIIENSPRYNHISKIITITLVIKLENS